MKLSYLAPLFGHSIPVNREISEQFNLDKNCYLYGTLFVEEHCVVLSTVPVESWDNVWKLTVYTAAAPGTLAKISGVITKLNINMLTTWSAATGGQGQGCMTAIVELYPDGSGEEIKMKEVVDAIEKECEQLLMQSKIFRSNGVSRVKLEQLTLLRALKAASSKEYQYEVPVKDWTLDFSRAKTFSPANGDVIKNDQVLERLRRLNTMDNSPSFLALLSPDTEERYILLSLLDGNSKLSRISFDVRVDAKPGEFKGYFHSALEVVADCGLNIFSSRNMTKFKADRVAGHQEIEILGWGGMAFTPGADAAGQSLSQEFAEFSFLVDIDDSTLASKTREEQEDALCKKFNSQLSEHARSTGGRIELLGGNNAVVVTEQEFIWPRCFLATNAKKDSAENIEYAKKLFRMLYHMGFHPVHVDIAQGPLLGDVKSLLGACPLLVSLHLPEEKNRLNNEEVHSHCPSDWVIYEECYFAGLGRDAFKMIHSKVRPPSYLPGEVTLEFHSIESFEDKLIRLRDVISKHLTRDSWRDALKASGDLAAKLDPAALKRNLYKEFFGDGK